MESSGAPDTVDAGTRDDPKESREGLQRAVFPRYQVAEEIGRGGMAFVFRGWDTAEMRPVAFKVLKRHIAAAVGPARFLREARLLGQLHHPGILPVLDSGHIDLLYYFVMPLVDGETLQRRLERDSQLPLEEARGIISQVAAALDHAHDAGVIHRDIKPSNLFLSGGRIQIADFGIAKDLSPAVDESTTSTGLVVGTALYMSPEQADGQHHADRRADVYSLGCVAYEMIAGEPPFVGPNPQAILARHRATPAPSARVIRPEVPAGVDAVIRKAMAKSPADRYQRAGDFAFAISDPAMLAAAAREAEAEQRPALSWRVPLLILALAVAILAAVLLRPARPLAPERVVVFPLGVSPPSANQEGVGVEVALMIGSALEFTEPLEWIDGLPLLEASARRDAAMLTTRDARRIARAAGARWYVDGTVIRRRDSVTVVLRLNDAAGDSVVGRRSATRVATEPAQAGLDAVNQLLPRLVEPGQRLGDLSALADRHPAAVASWLEGEREYRRFNFAAAMEFERRAVAADSALAVAALRGAQAASWLNDMPEAGALAKAALRHVDLLPPRMADFTRGLDAYLTGQADSAVHWLGLAIRRSPQWTEAHMALGEVYYHLLPAMSGPPDSLARAEFALAAADTGFSPPLFHLAEIAVRRRSPAEAQQTVGDFLRRVKDEGSQAQLGAMLACARGGRRAVEWPKVAGETPLEALRAAKMLTVGATFPGCAEDGFRAVRASRDAPIGERWGAFLGLQGLLAAEGRTSELRALVDSAAAALDPSASQLYLLDALAGVDVGRDASALAARMGARPTDEVRPFTLWLLGAWRARNGDRAGTDSLRRALSAQPADAPDPWAAHYADALQARLLLLAGDTAGAIAGLGSALGVGRRDALEWSVGESLAADRLLLAELLLARRRPSEAMAVAGLFDHPAPAAFLPFLPASLALRRQAALALGRAGEARGFQERLLALGQGAGRADDSPSSTVEAP